MTNTAIKALLSQGEGLTVEYKECKTSLGNSVFETVCSFSNRYGGYIFLGVNDKGGIQGVEPSFGLNLTHNSKRDYLSFRKKNHKGGTTNTKKDVGDPACWGIFISLSV